MTDQTANPSPAAELEPATIIELLELEPLPEEGGRWKLAWIDERCGAIYYLMQPGDFSAMHRLTGPELWHFYAGSPVEMVLLDPDGSVRRPTLGPDLVAGERPLQPVATGVWMGASTTGAWTLVGTTMAPPYDPAGFELGDRDELVAAYPAAADAIVALTRLDPP